MNLTPEEKKLGKQNFDEAVGTTRRTFLQDIGIIGGTAAGAANTIANNHAQGVEIAGASTANVIVGNTIQNSGANGVLITDSANNNTIDSNTITANSNSGVLINSTNNGKANHNIVETNMIGGTVIGQVETLSANLNDGVSILSAGPRNQLVSNTIIGKRDRGLNRPQPQLDVLVARFGLEPKRGL